MKGRHLELLLLVGAVACAPSLPEPYVDARAAAERAYHHGRYEEAAERWKRAAEAAERPRDARHAQFRAAASLARAGRFDEARKLYAQLASDPEADRAGRAAFERARMLERAGREKEAYVELRKAIVAHPDSGAAPGALLRLINREVDEGGSDRAIAWLDELRGRVAGTELEEHVAYRAARLVEAEERWQDARRRFLDVADSFPYPFGAFWDDALWRAASADEKMGHPKRAIRILRRMLSKREPSHLTGSYQRPRYSEAQFRIAEIYRDQLKDSRRARREFEKTWRNHETSLLRDDAMWSQARLAHAAGDRAEACRVLAALRERVPESRYVACARLLCPDASTKGECRDYIARELDSPARR